MAEIIDINTLFGPLPAASTDRAVDSLLAMMEKHHVTAACTLSTLGLLLDPNVGNTATKAACTEHKELLPVATLNPIMYFGDNTPIMKLQEDGFRVVRFFPSAQSWPPSFGPFKEIVRSLAATSLPIMINIGALGEITELQGILASYPSSVILSTVNVSLLAETISALREHSNWHVDISHLLSPGAIQLIADKVGAERLLFGSGAPSRPIASIVNTLKLAGLSSDQSTLVLSGNAQRILKI